jgi:hypothetical protein
VTLYIAFLRVFGFFFFFFLAKVSVKGQNPNSKKTIVLASPSGAFIFSCSHGRI